MIDRLRQLAIFGKTVDHGSFRGAARELRLSPSVVSHHISQLEEHLGVALLYRSTRKLRLTTDGERLLLATRKMMAAVEGELMMLSESANDPSGELRLTAPAVLSKSRFMDVLAGFMATYPKVRLSLDFSDERRNIIDDGFDIAIRMAPIGTKSATGRHLFRLRRVLVATPEFLDRQPTITNPVELRDWNWLELSPTRNIPTRFTKSTSEQVVQRKNIHCSCNDAHGLYGLACAGAGLAVVPEFIATDDIATGRVVVVLPDWEMDPLTVFANWPPNAPRDGLINLLVDDLRKNMADDWNEDRSD